MFGGSYAVGVGITPVQAAPWPTGATPAGAVDRPSRLGEVLPPSARSDTEIAADLGRITQIEGVLVAYPTELVAELAARRPAAVDTPTRAAPMRSPRTPT